jgi:hypothetical protein
MSGEAAAREALDWPGLSPSFLFSEGDSIISAKDFFLLFADSQLVRRAGQPPGARLGNASVLAEAESGRAGSGGDTLEQPAPLQAPGVSSVSDSPLLNISSTFLQGAAKRRDLLERFRFFLPPMAGSHGQDRTHYRSRSGLVRSG